MTTTNSQSPLLTPAQAAEMLNIAVGTLRKRAMRGLIPCVRTSAKTGRSARHRRYRLADIQALIGGETSVEYGVRFTYPGEEPYVRPDWGDLTPDEAAEIAYKANVAAGGDVATVVSRTVSPWTELTR